MRTITFTYDDPVDLIWLRTAADCGITVQRDSTVFASWDGQGVLTIGTAETLDADDSLAQMIFHEMCHALVEGPEALRLPDWGLDIDNPAQRVREHACLRLQAALADAHGLREFFAATTNFRKYYDNLPENPLAENADPAVVIAKTGWRRATEGPWAMALQRALAMTAAIASVVREMASPTSLWALAKPCHQGV